MMNKPAQQKLVPGIIGMARATDQVYYDTIHRLGEVKISNDTAVNSLRTVMVTVDFHAFVGFLQNGDRTSVEHQICDAASSIRAAGADFLVMTANTCHGFLGETIRTSPLPFLDITDVCCSALRDRAHRRIGILGTGVTVKEGVYERAAREHGLSTVYPSPQMAESINNLIFTQLISERITNEGTELVKEAIREMYRDGADAVVLACTDLTHLAHNLQGGSIPALDSTRLHSIVAANCAFTGVVSADSAALDLASVFA